MSTKEEQLVKTKNRTRYSVYVIELDDRAGPRRDPRYPKVYVGQTAHDPDRRFRQHKDGARNKRGPLFSRIVRRYGVRLRPDLYGDEPQLDTRDEAIAAERRLAERLEAEGYTVHYG